MTHNEQRGHWIREGLLACGTGTLFGVTNTLVGHPFDTIKTKMQAQSSGIYMHTNGALPALRQVIEKEGFRGLYRGVIPPMFGSAVYRSLQFSVFEALYTKWDSPLMATEIPGTKGLQLRVIAAGMCAATARAVCESPIEYAKVRRQTGQEWYARDMYKGFPYQWARTGGLMTSYFIMIDSVRRHTELLKTPFGQFLASGGCASIAFWLVWPFETLKNQIQAGTVGAGNTIKERIAHLVREHGVMRGLFRGIVPGTMSVFFRNGASMIVMLEAQKQLTKYGWR